ncbi:unnamed protein product [Phytophthora fragariaefolia]|uniref:Unnamed protein product n=1 Tax=Phytophthora fragariaefolia TaxID=1490495 RepID=A0A9W6YA37_9STRA|nr:unnamed protein product [Phytophthora fragariaefolia]GMF61989.1 unnamed protein product [Phytophthora fragariaefolia]
MLLRAPKIPNESDIVESATSSGEDIQIANGAGSESFSSGLRSTDDENVEHDEKYTIHPDLSFGYDGEA